MKRKPKKNPTREPPKLRFTPTAWAKLVCLRDLGDTEVGAFGICPTDPLLVEDVQLVKQSCTFSTVAFDDESVADFFEDQVENGLEPQQFARVWIHTHPGQSADPSHTDEETFARVFGGTDWAVMFILACGGETYARMRVKADPIELILETQVDFSTEFSGSQFDDWEAEYSDNVVRRHTAHRLDDIWFLMDDLEETTTDVLEAEDYLGGNQLLYHLMEEQFYDDHFQPSQSTDR